MIVLDTDHISLLQHSDSPEGQRLLRRLDLSIDQEIVTTVVTVEEQMRGWLRIIARYRDLHQQRPYYDKLISFIRFFSHWRILPFGCRRSNRFRLFSNRESAWLPQTSRSPRSPWRTRAPFCLETCTTSSVCRVCTLKTGPARRD